MKLYEISNDLKALRELEDSDDESMLPAIRDTIDGLQMSFTDKTYGICSVIRNLEVEAKSCREEAERLSNRARTAERKRQWLRDYLQLNMENSGIDKVNTGKFSVSLRGVKPTVEVTRPLTELPRHLVTTTITQTANKEAILDLHRTGQELPDGITIHEGKTVMIK